MIYKPVKPKRFCLNEISSEFNLVAKKGQYWLNRCQKDLDLVNVSIKESIIEEKTLRHKHKSKNPLTKITEDHDVDECVLMVQSPSILFCYWSLSNFKKNIIMNHLNAKWVDIQKKLRLYDITAIFFDGHNAHRYQDYHLSEDFGKCFINNLITNRTYCVDVGVETKEGNFFSVLRSNPIDTPRASEHEAGLFTNAVDKWKHGKVDNPEWLEGFSSYSFYQKLK